MVLFIPPPRFPCLPSTGRDANWETELCHFCWRPRDAPLDEPELDDTLNPAESTSKTNGRIFVLKFQSSSARHIFWLQSKPQGRKGNPAWVSPRDRKIGEIVDKLLQGEEVDVNGELRSVTNNNDDDDATHDDDETMEDVEGTGDSNEHHEGGNGGAGPDATGGDFRKEGSGAREGGADGARA
jgi:26S proteasome regulatory subunit N13